MKKVQPRVKMKKVHLLYENDSYNFLVSRIKEKLATKLCIDHPNIFTNYRVMNFLNFKLIF